MKHAILFAISLSVTASALHAQSLKETLFSGKLKSDSGSVVRKGDDLSTKIDTTTRKKPEPVAVNKPASGVAGAELSDSTATAVNANAAAAETVAAPGATVAKDNNKIWKDFIDEFTGTLRTEVMTSKKIKDGTYSVLIEYEIGVDGQVSVLNVSASPESSFLANQVKERLTFNAPQLNPVLMTNGKPRKVLKKQMLTLAK